MQMKKIDIEALALPKEIAGIVGGAPLFDSSCSAAALTVFVDCDAAVLPMMRL